MKTNETKINLEEIKESMINQVLNFEFKKIEEEYYYALHMLEGYKAILSKDKYILDKLEVIRVNFPSEELEKKIKVIQAQIACDKKRVESTDKLVKTLYYLFND